MWVCRTAHSREYSQQTIFKFNGDDFLKLNPSDRQILTCLSSFEPPKHLSFVRQGPTESDVTESDGWKILFVIICPYRFAKICKILEIRISGTRVRIPQGACWWLQTWSNTQQVGGKLEQVSCILKLYKACLCISINIKTLVETPRQRTRSGARWIGYASVYMLPHFNQDAFVILIAWTLYSSDLLELMLQTHRTCGVESVFLLYHSFCVQMMVPDANLSVSSYQPWKNMYAEMIQLQVRVCVYVVLHCSS